VSKDDRTNVRVLMVDALSGTNDFAVALSESLASRCKLTVFTVENTRINEGSSGINVLRAWPLFGGGIDTKIILRLVKSIASLLKELWRHRGQTVHSQFPRFPTLELAIFILAKPFLHNLIFTVHNAVPHERSGWREALLYLWYRLPDRIVVLSDHVRLEIIQRFGIQPERITIIPHGNYLALRQHCSGLAPSEPVAATIRNLDDKLVVFQFGVIRQYKGIDTLIQAARQLPSDLPWQILVAGGGSPSLVERYRSDIAASGLESRISIRHEFLLDRDLAALIERADILVFPYRGISQSGALLMGMTFAKPCVCTDLPGFREYAREDEAEFFNEEAGADELAMRLLQLLKDPARRQRLGNAVGEAATSRYSWGTIADRYLKVYTRDERLV